MTCANVLVGLGKDREGMETGDAGWEGGDVAICVAPRRERRSMLTALVAMLKISIHAPAKGATAKSRRDHAVHTISIHAPAKGATRGPRWLRHHTGISIHAPAKGATKSGKVYTNNNGISIHAPVKGAAGNRRTCVHRTRDFNPRSREGSDARPGTQAPEQQISIHTPAKGATAR